MALFKITRREKLTPTEDRRIEGDRARDARDWPAAAEAYKAYLETQPSDAAIWVQCGHAHKEQGLLQEAEAAYRTAVSLAPEDADARHHLTALLARLEQPEQAAETFRLLADVAPAARMITEVEDLGYSTDVSAVDGRRSAKNHVGQRYVELKDLFQYLSLHTTVTGITRVTLGLVNHVLSEMNAAEADAYSFVHFYGDAEGVLLIEKAKLRRLVRLAMLDKPDIAAMQSLIADIRQTSPVVQIETGAVYLIVGAFWEFVANPAWLSGMKQRGVTLGAYIYDLIPITHAHYCMKGLTDAFTAAFAEVARLLDFALTISEFVAKQVTGYVEQHGIAPFPTIAVPLAHELRFASEMARLPGAVTAKLDELDGVSFVLCVCTIEARKNHGYLFYIWQRMIDEGIDVPDLVFVGRPGWRIQDLLEQIAASSNLDGRLHIMHGLSDEDLQALYDRCLFTVFPSFVEGWGLPVGESLSRGKVCVASSTTSIPEVGGEFAVYIDPFNLESGYDTVRRLILDPTALAEQETKLKNRFVARTWSDVATDFFTKVDTVVSGLDEDKVERIIYAPSLQPGEVLRVRTMENVGAGGATYVANPERLVFSQGWRAVDTRGTWMLDPAATLRLRTECSPGQRVSVLLHLGTSPWVRSNHTMRISAAGPIQRRRLKDDAVLSMPLAEDSDIWVRLKGQVDGGGYLTIMIRVDGEVTAEGSNIPVALRFYAVGYAALDDIGARLNLLENAMLTTQFKPSGT